jgi:hypothetical protein
VEDISSLFRLFEAISCLQCFTKIPGDDGYDALRCVPLYVLMSLFNDRRIPWADDAPSLTLAQRLVCAFERNIWQVWRAEREKVLNWVLPFSILR